MEEVKTGKEIFAWHKNDVVEGILTGIREDVGVHKSNVYLIEDNTGEEKQYWGSKALDYLMASVKAGSKVKIECTADDVKFPSGMIGKTFKVWKE